MSANNDISVISVNDVIETLKICDAWCLKPETQDAVYEFASMLTGLSVDKIVELEDEEENYIATFRTEGFCSIPVSAQSADEAWDKAEKRLGSDFRTQLDY